MPATPSLPALAAAVAALADRVAALEAKIAANGQRIDELESRYDQIASDAVATISQLEQVVEDLRTTDEASGWKQWKEEMMPERTAAIRRGDDES